MGTIPSKKLRSKQDLYLERERDEKEQVAARRAAMGPGSTIMLNGGVEEKEANDVYKESSETEVLNSLQKKKGIQ